MSLSKPTRCRRRDKLDCILSGLALLLLSLSDRFMSVFPLPLVSLTLRGSGGCEMELLLSLDKLLRIATLGRRMVPAIVSDLLGTLMFPVATKVCDGS